MAKHGAHFLPGLQNRPYLKELVLVLGIRLDIRLQLLVPDERHVRGEHHQALSAGICVLLWPIPLPLNPAHCTNDILRPIVTLCGPLMLLYRF